MPVTF